LPNSVSQDVGKEFIFFLHWNGFILTGHLPRFVCFLLPSNYVVFSYFFSPIRFGDCWVSLSKREGTIMLLFFTRVLH
jgi:hypothetical protein